MKYIAESNVCIGDTSSILAECCALDKPIITWKVPTSERTVPEIEEILARCTWQIATFEELEPAIERCLAHPEELQEERKEASAIFFDELDGKAGFRVANEILKILPELKMNLVDGHCHLASLNQIMPVESLLKEANEAGITHFLFCFLSKEEIAFHRQYSLPGVLFSAGIHPHYSECDLELKDIEELCAEKCIWAVGEIGLWTVMARI